MPTNHSYPGLPRAPASANLPRKPGSQGASLESSAGHGSASKNANNDLRLNVLAETPGHYSTVRPTTPVFPQLSSTTQDILARVQGGRSIPAASGPPKGLLRDANSVTGLLPSSVSSKSENMASPFPTTSKNPATGPIRSVQQHTSTPNARQTTSGGSITNSDPAKTQTFTSFKLTGQTSGSPRPGSTESTIQVGGTHPQASMTPASTSTNPAPSSSSSSSRRQRSYVLSDGTVVSSGKGLGRGRPGIKRGPRKPKLDPTSSTASTTNTPAPSSLPEKKRKHSVLREDEERVKTPVSVDDDDEEEDSDSYTPQATQTRSGRSTQRPQSFVSANSPAAKKPRLAAELPNAQIKNSLIKKKIYRGREQNALCEYCLRGRGPTNNAIVFCDGCNLCWHQNCHDPRISKELVLDKTAEWFCKDCVTKLKSTATEAKDTNPQQIDESTVKGVPNAAEMVTASTERPVRPSNTTVKNAAAAASGMPGRSLDLQKRQQYFSSLSRQTLIDLLLQAYSLAPELPIFNTARQINAPAPPLEIVPPPAPSVSPTKANPAPTLVPTTTPTPPPTISSTTIKTPSTMKPPPPPLPPLTTSPNPNLNPSRAAKAAAPKYTSPSSPSSESAEDSESEEEYQDDEEEEDYGPSHSKVYPKPGQGVMAMLPPDSADEHMLLEGAESRTFSHSLKRQGPLVVALG